MRRVILLILTIVLVFTLAACGSKPTKDVISTENTNDIALAEETDSEFQQEAEKNAEKYPATIGANLVTKGDHDFTGMKYYFKGELVKITNIENDVGDTSAWLVKNENGYVMPIQHEYFKAEVGDTVEVWGTLSGNGYANMEGIDNVVGQTGSMHAIIVAVDGELQ